MEDDVAAFDPAALIPEKKPQHDLVSVLETKEKDHLPSSLHRQKDSETDEIFVEALEGSIEDGISSSNDLNSRSDEAAVGVSYDADKTSDANLQVGEGSLSMRHEDEIKEDLDDALVYLENHRKVNAPSDDNVVSNGTTANVYDKGGTESEGYDSKDNGGDLLDGGNATGVHLRENLKVGEKTELGEAVVLDVPFVSENGTRSSEATDLNPGHVIIEDKQSEIINADETRVKNTDMEDVDSDNDRVQIKASEVNEESADQTPAVVSSEDQNGPSENFKDAWTGEEKDLKNADPTSVEKQGEGVPGLDASSYNGAHDSKNGHVEQTLPFAFSGQKEVHREDHSGSRSTSVDSAALVSGAEKPSISETIKKEKDGILASVDMDGNLPRHALDSEVSSEVPAVESASPAGLAEVQTANAVRSPAGLGQASSEVVAAESASPVGLTAVQTANPVRPPTQPAGLGQARSEVPAVKSASPVVQKEVQTATPVQSPARPAGLGRAAPLPQPTARAVQQVRPNGAVSAQSPSQVVEETGRGEIEEVDETREKLQMIRVKFLRLAHRLGQTPHNVVVAQVLYRLGLAEQLRGRTGGRAGAFSFDRAASMAEGLEQSRQEPLDFSCTIMVLGKSGVGKSATINSIFDEVMFNTDAFEMGTKKVQDVVGTVQGIRVRVVDTPGLLPSWSDQRKNEKILQSVKQFIKKSPPDIVLYLDRLDMPNRDLGDTPLLRTITDVFGPSIWFNAIVVLTHAASAPPEGPNGTASTYDMFVTQRSHAVQQAIRQAAGDIRLMNPVSLVENHSACRTNRAGQRVLPNGQVWKPHLLLLSFASKILAEANTLLKLQDTPSGKGSTARSRAPPLPFLLSSLLQSRPQLKLPEDQLGDEDDVLDDGMDESSDSDDESEYEELPPFKSLTKVQLGKLTKEQRNAYYDELEYRERLLMKMQLKQEKKRRKMMKKMAESAKDMPDGESGENGDNLENDNNGAAALPVPMPDLPLPASFDADNPTHRYRHLDTSNQWIVRPIPDTNGWDHDVGYDLMMVERMFVIKEKVPVSLSGQISKDKKEANLQMELSSSLKHGEGKATNLGIDMQSVGRDMAYTFRSETKFSNRKHNKATAGLSMTLLGDAVTAGLKVEDKFIPNKKFRCVVSGGAMMGRGDVAYGGSLEATLRDDDPLGRFLSSLGLSIMDWHGDLAIGCNLQSQIPVGRFSNLIARANLNNRGSGQVSLRLNSSEQIQLALIGLIPLVKKIMGQSQQYSSYGH